MSDDSLLKQIDTSEEAADKDTSADSLATSKQDAVYHGLVEDIASGRYKVGEQIPSVRQLADRYQVSITPVWQALTSIAERGLVRKAPGRRGYYVAQRNTSSESTDSKIMSAALVYESARFHPEEADAKLVAQVLIDEIGRLPARRGSIVRSIPHVPVPTQGEDLELLEVLSKHKVVVFLNHCYRHWIGLLESRGCFVLEVNQPALPGFNWINWDREKAFAAMIDHLLEQGHKRIGFIGRYSVDWRVMDKFVSYFHGLYQHKLPCDTNLVEWIPQTAPMDGYHAAQRLIARLKPGQLPTALLVDTDARGAQTVAALHEAGLRVPDDISVASIDNRPEAASCQPPLTTVGPDWTKIAEVTLDVIDRGLHSRQSQRINQVVPFKMALRESTAPPAKR